MKFTDGFWEIKPEFKAFYACEARDVRATETELTMYCPFKPIRDRGDTLNIGQLTVTVTSPLIDVLRVKIVNHIGSIRKGPEFSLHARHPQFEAKAVGSEASARSGNLELKVQLAPFAFSFCAHGKRLTGMGKKSLAAMSRSDGRRFISAGLDLSVGELVYGLGERFTAMVKNGQAIEIWNEDGGTSSEMAYKNIPFYMTNRGYGVFVNTPNRVSFEVASEKVEQVQFSVEDEALEYLVIYGPTPKEIIQKYTALTGRPALLPLWSYGLWLTTSFTTDYDEQTVTSFIEGMEKRDIPLSVFHFDCFWMKEFEWCSFEWDETLYPNPHAMLKRLHDKGLKICVWINPYIAQKSPLFLKGMEKGYLLKAKDGRVFQWDKWQAGMALVDFTNPGAKEWFAEKLGALLDMGVDCFKTDFGERIPYDVSYFDGSDPIKMHNCYTLLYNECVFNLLEAKRGKGEAVVFARSATVGSQKYPVHWGGDCTASYASMAESLRGGLSLMASGFGFWSHDIGGFESDTTPDLYKRWAAFGMLSSHSRLHGSTSYRVPWRYDEEACDVLRRFAKLKNSLLPTILNAAVEAHETGVPVMRPMHMEFPDDPCCEYLDRQYMLGDSLLVAPVLSEDGEVSFYLPEGIWTHFISGEKVCGRRWITRRYDYFSLPLFVRQGSIIPVRQEDSGTNALDENITYHVYEPEGSCESSLRDAAGEVLAAFKYTCTGNAIAFACDGSRPYPILLSSSKNVTVMDNTPHEESGRGVLLRPVGRVFSVNVEL